MQSGGGVFTFEAARERPVFMVESGPAAGVMAAAHLGNALGCRDVLSFDMGGTTAKAALIQGGAPRVTKDYEVGASAPSGVEQCFEPGGDTRLRQQALGLFGVILIVSRALPELINGQGPLHQAAGDGRGRFAPAPDRLDDGLAIDGV